MLNSIIWKVSPLQRCQIYPLQFQLHQLRNQFCHLHRWGVFSNSFAATFDSVLVFPCPFPFPFVLQLSHDRQSHVHRPPPVHSNAQSPRLGPPPLHLSDFAGIVLHSCPLAVGDQSDPLICPMSVRRHCRPLFGNVAPSGAPRATQGASNLR